MGWHEDLAFDAISEREHEERMAKVNKSRKCTDCDKPVVVYLNNDKTRCARCYERKNFEVADLTYNFETDPPKPYSWME